MEKAGYKYDFWYENKSDQHFELNSVDLKEQFLEFLKKQFTPFLNDSTTTKVIRDFIGSENGLKSSYNSNQLDVMYSELIEVLTNYEKSQNFIMN